MSKIPKGYQSMTDFERMLVEKEKSERDEAKKKYIHGIQGIEGGHCSEKNKGIYD